jgi:hypothetical protein
LFGHRTLPTYTDTAPPDGIDDARATRLLEIAERFSPILRRNNFSVPRDFRTIEGMRLVMHADQWVDGKLYVADSVDLRCCTRADNGGAPDSSAGAVDDVKLAALLKQFDPRRAEPRYHGPGARHETILYFDFPGEHEKSWRQAYQRHDPRISSILAHPFIHETESEGERRFTLVMQFWFYYPFNDSANNHEGDWEHLNVAVTTRARAAQDSALAGPRGGLSEKDLDRMLNAEAGIPLDSLTIRFVTYYFHQHAMVLDYLGTAVSHDSPKTPSGTRLTSAIWEDADFVDVALRKRLAIAGGRLATHPIGYVGGNSRGLDELLAQWPRFQGSFNRNSHGTYPFPGTWRAIGPVGASEKVFGEVEPRIRKRARDGADSIPWYDLIEDDRYVTYQRASIRLVPDWERVLDQMSSDARVRRDWAWLILPVHFGYPASKSPGGGAIAHTNLGNVAPRSPTSNASWNRPFASGEHPMFDPHVLRIAFAPVTPFTGLQNGWGFFNVPIALAGLIPGMQVVTAQLMPWASGALGILGASPPKTFYAGTIPNRFTSFGAGRFLPLGGDDFARLLPHEENDSIAALLERGTHIDDRSYRRRGGGGYRIWLQLHYGDRLSIENTLSVDTSQLNYAIRDGAGAIVRKVSGILAMRQLTSGIRLDRQLFRDGVRGFVRAGYAWTWYEVDHATLDGRRLATKRTRGGHAPSVIPSTKWWPNSAYGGGGLELFAPRRAWIFGRLGYGVATDVNVITHPLRGPRCRCLVKPGDASLSLVFGW